jgi:hypothetical protein
MDSESGALIKRFEPEARHLCRFAPLVDHGFISDSTEFVADHAPAAGIDIRVFLPIGVSFCHRQIAFVHPARSYLGADPRRRFGGFSEHDAPRNRFVEPLHHAQIDVSRFAITTFDMGFEVLEKRYLSRTIGLGQHACGLVDDEKMVVFKKNYRLEGFRALSMIAILCQRQYSFLKLLN